ncbi:unnamed protein product, partial [marine sediment metagenome]
DPAIWGWQNGEEPYATGQAVSELKTMYTQLKATNPNWQSFIAFAVSDWDIRGYDIPGICDVFCVDLYFRCAPLNVDIGPEDLRYDLIEGKWAQPILRMIDQHGITFCPMLLAADYFTWSNAIRQQYDIYNQVINRPLAGAGYYNSLGFMPEMGDPNAPSRFLEVKALNQHIGGQTGIIPRPEEVITTKTITHSCAATISYNISSWGENNDPLTCPHCGLALGPEGIKGSEEIVELPEVITPVIVTCSKCGSQLKLSVSSFANKNIQQ